MNKKIEEKLSMLENSRYLLIKELEKIDTQKLNVSPYAHKWSVAQVFYHLNQAESLSIIYVSKKMKDINRIKNTGIYEALRLWLVKVAFILPFKYKAPEVLGDMPEKVDYTEVLVKWNDTRKKLRELISLIPEDMLSKNIFKQPTAGRLNIYQMLDFMQAHFNRHLKQISTIIK